MTRKRFLVRCLAAGAALAAISLAAPAASAAPANHNSPDASADATEQILQALQRDLGLNREQAERQLAAQKTVRDLSTRLRGQLGADFAGDWYDQRSGKLVVAVTSAKRAAEVRAAGAEAKLVANSRAKLDGINAEIDALVAVDKAAKSGIAGWHLDAQHNAVVVTVLSGQAGQDAAKALAKLARHGSAVRIEHTDVAPRTTAWLHGGDPIGGCSVGFNAFAGSTRYVLFAGHCGGVGAQQYGNGGVWIGPIVGSSFPGNDYALVRVDNPGAWTQGPYVNAYNGGGVYVMRGWFWSAPPAGLSVCKSGKTTGLTCGVVRASNESVNYTMPDGSIVTVHQLTRHTACVERGDSGGSVFSWDASGNWAEGLNSGATLRLADGRCLAVGGQENRSWFQPVGEAISAYGVTLYTG